MKKFTYIFLTLVILACGAFITLKVVSFGSRRAELSQYPLLRKILYLHNDGDAKHDYLGKNNSTIMIEVEEMSNLNVDPKIIYDLAAKIEKITSKKTKVIFDPPVAYVPQVDSASLDAIANKRIYFAKPGQAALYIMILSARSADSHDIGLTYKEDGLIVYANTIRDLVPQSKEVFNDYMYSTLLHEFGHQLGLPHNNKPGCLMNPSADISTSISQDLDTAVLDFCPYEKGLISANVN